MGGGGGVLESHGSRTRVKGRAVNEEKKLKKASIVLLTPHREYGL